MPTDRLSSRPHPNLPRFSVLRRCRRAAVCLVAAAALLAAALPASASARTLPPEGIFDVCSLDTQMSTCLQRLQVMHDGGFQVVVITVDSTSLTSLQTYANAAHSLGMSVMWAISDAGWWSSPLSSSVQNNGYWSNFATACGCTQDGQILSSMVHWLGSLPGTYGYYAADDSMLSAGSTSGVSQYVSTIKAADPNHPVILSSGDESQTAQYERFGDMNASELYPITTSTLMPVSSNRDWWDGMAQEASYDQGLANRAGKSSAFILQAFTFGDNLSDGQAVGVCTPSMSQQQCWNRLRYPTAADQLQLRNEVLKHSSPRIILWYSFPGTYGQAGSDTYSLYPTGATAASEWGGLTAAINAPAPSSGAVAHSTRAKHRRHHRRHHHRRHHRHHHHRRHHHRHHHHQA